MKSLTPLTTILISLNAISLNAIVSPVLCQTASSSAAFSRGCEQMMHKNFSSAISSFTEAISDDANDVNSYFRRGQSFFCVGNYKEAIVDFDRALAKGAGDYNVYLWKGTAYAKLDNMDLSVFNYEKAMRLNPKLVAPFKSSATSNTTNSVKSADAAKTVDAEKSTLESRIEAVRVAAANMSASRNVGAVEHEAKPKSSGSSTLHLGSNQKSIQAYETAARKIAENEIGYFRSGTTYSGLLNLSGSVIPLSGFGGQPEWVETAQKGRPYLTLKDPHRDLRDLDAQIVLHPQDATLYFQRARVYQQLRRSTDTLNDLNRAIELDGANAHYFLARAFYYHQLKNDNAAELEILRAQDVDPIVPSDLSFEMPAEKERG
jgi:tetratricopeptide (TPR) repeat protein